MFDGEVDAATDEGVAAEGEAVGECEGIEGVGIGFLGWQGRSRSDCANAPAAISVSAAIPVRQCQLPIRNSVGR